MVYQGAACNAKYGYGVVGIEFSDNIVRKVDLLAHEIGHNFGARHCDCPDNTMNPLIYGSLDFTRDNRNKILDTIEEVTCLDWVEEKDGEPHPCDDGDNPCKNGATCKKDSGKFVHKCFLN